MDESRKLFPYCLYQKRTNVDLKKPIDTCPTIHSSSESYATAQLKPFEFIELIQEMESYVMVPTKLMDIEVDIETMPKFLEKDTKTVHDVYKALIKIKSGLIELMANKVVADDNETSATHILNGMEEAPKYEAVLQWLKDHPEFAPGDDHALEWPSSLPSDQDSAQNDGHLDESVTSTASKMELPQDHVSHVLEIMQLFSKKLCETAEYVTDSYKKAFNLTNE